MLLLVLARSGATQCAPLHLVLLAALSALAGSSFPPRTRCSTPCRSATSGAAAGMCRRRSAENACRYSREMLSMFTRLRRAMGC
ncbi:hypothetical protein K466DRAFT_592804, partial [Polyporus arcularius HHB13444]